MSWKYLIRLRARDGSKEQSGTFRVITSIKSDYLKIEARNSYKSRGSGYRKTSYDNDPHDIVFR